MNRVTTMHNSPWRYLSIVAVPLVILLLANRMINSGQAERNSSSSPDSHLIVVMVVDQLRGDYLTRWQELFEKGGFRRLTEEGAWFQNCNYPFTGTVTGSGHASIATGTDPSRHGVISNGWYDRSSESTVYCATLPSRFQIPPSPNAKTRSGGGSGTPERLIGSTLSDAWHQASRNRSRIVALSSKDRGAVFLGGHFADVCCWYESSTGNFVTSNFYANQLPAWVDAFNKKHSVDLWFGKTWDYCQPQIDYQRYSGPPEAPGRATPAKMGRSFPHPLTGGLEKPGKSYYDAVYTSPMGNDLLIGLARRAIEADELGHHELPDLLFLSLSANDAVGHAFGPDSPEVLDITLRTDHLIHEFLDYLDQKVGKNRYTLILSADHGVCPLPEVSRQNGHPEAMRINEVKLKAEAQEYLISYFGNIASGIAPIDQFVDDDIYLNRNWLKALRRPVSEVQHVLADWVSRQKGILKAYTATELNAPMPASDPLGRMVQLSYHPANAGDVLVVPQPYCYFARDSLTGTTHGSPHPYDTHVPLLVYGPNVKPGIRQDLVRPQAVAPIMAHILGIQPPYLDYPVPDGLFVR